MFNWLKTQPKAVPLTPEQRIAEYHEKYPIPEGQSFLFEDDIIDSPRYVFSENDNSVYLEYYSIIQERTFTVRYSNWEYRLSLLHCLNIPRETLIQQIQVMRKILSRVSPRKVDATISIDGKVLNLSYGELSHRRTSITSIADLYMFIYGISDKGEDFNRQAAALEVALDDIYRRVDQSIERRRAVVEGYANLDSIADFSHDDELQRCLGNREAQPKTTFVKYLAELECPTDTPGTPLDCIIHVHGEGLLRAFSGHYVKKES